MKKLSIILSFLMIAAVFFVSCDNKTSAPPTEYKVTFDPDNGDEKTVVTVKEGEAVTKPEKDPVKENTVAFVAWVKDDGTAYNFEDKVTSDLTLKASYRTTAVVTFVNGETKTTKEVEYGKTVNKPADEVKREVGGFASWRNEKNEIYDFNTPVTSDITLTASVWKEITSTDTVTDEGAAAYGLAQEIAEKINPETTSETKITLQETTLKNMIVYALGRCDLNYLVGYWVYDGVRYYNYSERIETDAKYLYCEITDKENKTVDYSPSAKTVKVNNLKISAKFSEGTKGTGSISPKEDNPAFKDVKVSVVINGIEKINDSQGSYRFDYTLNGDTTNPIYVESSISENNMIITYSNKSGDYLLKINMGQQ